MYIGPWQEYYLNKGSNTRSYSRSNTTAVQRNANSLNNDKAELIANIEATLSACLDPVAAKKAIQSLHPLLENSNNRNGAGTRQSSYIPGLRQSMIPAPVIPPTYAQHSDMQYTSPSSGAISVVADELDQMISGRSNYSEPIRGSKAIMIPKRAPSSGGSVSNYFQSMNTQQNAYKLSEFSPSSLNKNEVNAPLSISSNQSSYSINSNNTITPRTHTHSKSNPSSSQASYTNNHPSITNNSNNNEYTRVIKSSDHYSTSTSSVIRLLNDERNFRIKQQNDQMKKQEMEQLELQYSEMKANGIKPDFEKYFGWKDKSNNNNNSGIAQKEGVNKNVDKVKQMQDLYLSQVRQTSINNINILENNGNNNKTIQYSTNIPEIKINKSSNSYNNMSNTSMVMNSSNAVETNNAVIKEKVLSQSDLLLISKYFDIQEDDEKEEEEVTLLPNVSTPPPIQSPPRSASPYRVQRGPQGVPIITSPIKISHFTLPSSSSSTATINGINNMNYDNSTIHKGMEKESIHYSPGTGLSGSPNSSRVLKKTINTNMNTAIGTSNINNNISNTTLKRTGGVTSNNNIINNTSDELHNNVTIGSPSLNNNNISINKHISYDSPVNRVYTSNGSRLNTSQTNRSIHTPNSTLDGLLIWSNSLDKELIDMY